MDSCGPSLIWKKKTEPFTFRLGRRTLRRLSIPSLSLETPCTSLSVPLETTLAALPRIPGDCRAIVLPAYPVERKPPRFAGLFKPVFRYVSNSGPRQLIHLRGAFAQYAAKFPHKRRHWLMREARKFAEHCGGSLDLRTFQVPEDMASFRETAAAITSRTYKSRIGARFEETREELEALASERAALGYVLYCKGSPVAYEYFRVQGNNILLASTAFDPAYAKFSPGTVLLWTVLQDLFEEQAFDYLDFLWGQYGYKKFFATATLDVAAVFCFRNTPANLALAGCHFALILATRAMLWVTRDGPLARLRRGRPDPDPGL